jgi:6-phosphogluconolactonase
MASETMNFAVYPTPELAIRAAADLFTARAPSSVALSGGSTPRELYGLLASDDYRDRIDWDELSVFFGDERAVAPSHPDSNYGMARRAMLDLVPIPDDNVHRMEADDPSLEAAADRYARLLPARLDLVLLGMGPDGHTASLFPGREALEERERRCVPTRAADGSRRLTLTLPTIDAARHVLFLVLGAEKRSALDRIRAGERLPAGLVSPSEGDVTWIVDEAAYGGPG